MSHAKLGGSSCDRWMNCPGSIRMIDAVPEQFRSRESRAAAEGTAAHTLGEWCLRSGKDPEEYPLRRIKVPSWPREDFEVDEEMIEAVGIYVKLCRALAARLGAGAESHVETLVHPLGRDDMWGTADFAVEQPFGEIHVVDLKYGKGVVVDPRYNSQGLFYAVGFLDKIGPRAADAQSVTIWIAQPRAGVEGDADDELRFRARGVRSWTPTRDEVADFSSALGRAGDRTRDPDAPLVAGAHCKFCPASGRCPAQRESALALLSIPAKDPTVVAPPPVPTDPADLARVLDVIPRWDDFVRACEGAAQRLLENGGSLPGYKLVRKRSTRRWASDDVAEPLERIFASLGIGGDDLYTEPELRSPNQVEKALTRAGIKPTQRAEILADLVVKPPGGLTLTREEDPREAISGEDPLDLLR